MTVFYKFGFYILLTACTVLSLSKILRARHEREHRNARRKKIKENNGEPHGHFHS